MPASRSMSTARRVRVERGIYRQPNGKYAVCFMLHGKPRFRTVEGDIGAARSARARLVMAARAGTLPVGPRLRFATVAGRWSDRFEAMVAVGERRARTLESHRYHLDSHLLPVFGARQIASITVDDVAALIGALAGRGLAPRTIAGSLATLSAVLRFALRRGYIADNPLRRLEAGERPRPAPGSQRALGQQEVARLLAACAPRYRLLLVTALYTGMRSSELLGLTWSDVDLDAGTIHVRAQLSRAHRDAPALRVAPKTRAAIRDIPLVGQLGALLRDHRRSTPFAAPADYVFATGRGTPLGHRNAERRGLRRATQAAGLDSGDRPALRMHDLRHTFASHLIIDLGLDVAQVSRILGHASVTTTLNIYTHLFDDARHATEIRARMTASPFARLLEPDRVEADNVAVLARKRARRHARARANGDNATS